MTTPVVVVVRVRPALARELSAELHTGKKGYRACVGLVDGKSEIFVTKKDEPVLIHEDGCPHSDTDALERFRFDYVFGTKATTDEVYYAALHDLVSSTVEGINNTILAYGQTGSGKTHTMLQGDRAIVSMLAQELFAPKRDCKLTINASYIQIYNKHVSDLLVASPTGGAQADSLPVRERDCEVFVRGITMVPIGSVAALNQIVAQGSKHRATIATLLNSTSSRSHAILTLYVDNPQLGSHAKINIVDLAGSERVKDSGVTGSNMIDAIAINSSLLALARVVCAVNNPLSTHVPYRDHPLCLLLQDAIGGNCKTTVIATVSPAQRHCHETVSTLRFARACSRVENRVHRNLHRLRSKCVTKRRQSPTIANDVPWRGLQVSALNGGRCYMDTSFGRLSYLAYGTPTDPVVMCLHGSPSDADSCYGSWLLPALVHSNYFVVALDMPACGRSGGTLLKCRSEYVLQKNGAAEVVHEVCAALGARRYSLVGYDWGAGIALAMATKKKFNRHLEHVVAFHPPGMSEHLDIRTLQKITPKVQLIFGKNDNMHPWKHWASTAKRLQKVLRNRYEQYIFKERKDVDIERAIVTFLTGKDPAKHPIHVYACPTIAEMDTCGDEVESHSNIVFASNALSYDAAIFEKTDRNVQAAQRFVERRSERQWLHNLYKALKTSTRDAEMLTSYLPPIDVRTLLQEPQLLVRCGAWSDVPTGFYKMLESPRFFPGRRVLVKAQVCTNSSSDTFLQYDAHHLGQPHTTWRAHIVRLIGATGVEVALEACTGGIHTMIVSRKEIEEWNQRHQFPRGVGTKVLFEDGLWVDYHRPLTKAKLWEIGCLLAPLAKAIDFTRLDDCVELQKQVVETVYRAIDMNTFQRDENDELTADGEHARAQSRYCGDNIARFACGGQGHCHTVTSTLAAMLLPWCDLFGIDLKYRGGCTIHNDGALCDSTESHQWLECTFRPTMESVVLDCYKEDRRRDGQYINLPISRAYKTALYPSCILNNFSGQRVTTISGQSDWPK